MPAPFDVPSRLRELLAERGVATSTELQVATGKSQATLSRALKAMSRELVVLGAGKRTRYGLPQPIRGLPAQQPLWWTDEAGLTRRFGTLTFLAGAQVHVSAEGGLDTLTAGGLPWFLAPLRLQGFLGREWAQRLGLDRTPDQWDVAQVLYAALRIDDHPGAISIGEPQAEMASRHPVALDERGPRYDTLATDVSATLPAGSSAGGEQSKFLAVLDSGEHVLVKFTPLRGTPFGERWHDLLHAEWLALQVVAKGGFAVAASRLVETPARTYLESSRFDRIGARGRRHAVPLDALHQAFVAGPRQTWAATCDALAAQRRLGDADAQAVRTLLAFGRLIGNSDMHFGNLSLWADAPATERFSLAPLYDMLPMRWRPDAFSGLHDYAAFEPVQLAADARAFEMARDFWTRVAEHPPASEALRRTAAEMHDRLPRL